LGVSLRTVKTRRARYTQQGLWGLVDQRAVRLSAATGRTDARLVAAIREVIDAETDTIQRRWVVKKLSCPDLGCDVRI
jgi:putative transposase